MHLILSHLCYDNLVRPLIQTKITLETGVPLTPLSPTQHALARARTHAHTQAYTIMNYKTNMVHDMKYGYHYALKLLFETFSM
jgi:hypothetical protein